MRKLDREGGITIAPVTNYRDEPDIMAMFMARYGFPSYNELIHEYLHLHFTLNQYHRALYHYNAMLPEYLCSIQRVMLRNPKLSRDEAEQAYYLFLVREALQRALECNITRVKP
jgi:hypothetical protein